MTSLSTDDLLIAAATDVGMRRTGNEDSHVVWKSDDSGELARKGVLLVVADGMGGANAGEVASRLTADTVLESLRGDAGDDPGQALRSAIERANEIVHDQAGRSADQKGMGTTCTAAVLRGGHVWLGHVGDSRAYLVRGETSERLTHDHTLVNQLVDIGHLTEEEARRDHRRNVITRSVGALPQVEVDAGEIEQPLKPGDAIVLCSDGLHGQVTDGEIGMIAGDRSPEEACRELIELANERGGPDNITVIVARVRDRAAEAAAPAPAAREAAARTKGAGSPTRGLALALLGLVVLAGLVGWALFGRKGAGPDAGGSTEPATTGHAPAPGASSGEPAAAEPTPVTSEPPAGEPATSAPASRGAAHVAAAGAGSHAPAKPASRNTTGGASAASPHPAPPIPPPATSGGVAASTPAVTTPSASAPAPPSTPAAPAEIVVSSRPFQPCRFKVDGVVFAEDAGVVTLGDLAPGHHVVTVEDGHNGSIDLPVDTPASAAQELVARLPGADQVGDLQVTVSGAGSARIYVDGAEWPRVAPCTIRGLASGTHTIRAFGTPGHVRQEYPGIEIAPGATAHLDVRF
ncbi:MAG TPA: Stp1/IreP family PP2C-type Ser/Thr phosphatase [Candidatus Acidoferrales bacterium]|nr:Stp1/IreP family PP2C-type Ser/Thr phosphatase [Candidatus Acidoferrales bacterium]